MADMRTIAVPLVCSRLFGVVYHTHHPRPRILVFGEMRERQDHVRQSTSTSHKKTYTYINGVLYDLPRATRILSVS